MRPRPLAAALGAAALLTTLTVTVAPAAGAATTVPTATAAAAATSPEAANLQQVVLLVTPRDRAGLRALARSPLQLSATDRAARLAQVLPGTARVEEVSARARALGLTVTRTTATSVTARADATRIRALFGSARAQDPQSPVGHALPSLPATLRGLVTVAGGGDETRPVRRPLSAALAQPALRQLYGLPAATTTAPSSSAPTIATLQFSDWNASDLTNYVQQTGLYPSGYDPVAAGAYTGVTVDTGPGDSSGAIEVALDQEALATLSPQTRQAAYFAPNTAPGQAEALNQIATEAATRHIVALSTSWGLCEQQAYSGPSDPQLTADEDAMNAVLAAGVTVFAATGDSGATDCLDSNGNPIGGAAVDTPASFPNVVGVGGTAGTTVSTLTGWSDQSGASGGGYSRLFPRPAFQDGRVPTSPVTGLSARGVPDIAAAAAPQTGLAVYSSAAGCNNLGANQCLVGGTSLAAPLAAAGFVVSLTARGITQGVGNILPWLYDSPETNGLRDVVGGDNGFAATGGWDPVTGLGSPNWTSLQNSSLLAGGTLTGGQGLSSASSQYALSMGTDGNLVVTGNGAALWQSGTAGNSGASLTMQSDGDAVVGAGGTPLWQSGTGSAGSFLTLRNDGTLAVVGASSTDLWSDGAAGSNQLWRGGQLVTGWYLHGGAFRVVMQSDGNLVIYNSTGAVWASHTGGNPGSRVVLQNDGNLVIYSPAGVALWASHTYGSGALRLAMQTDGNLVLYSATKAVWTPRTAAPTDTLRAGGSLSGGQQLLGGTYRLAMQTDGNLVVYSPTRALWASHTGGHPGSRVVLQTDGNLVVYGPTGPLWSSGTYGSGALRLAMQTDGNLVLYNATSAVWATHTHG